MRSDLAKLVSFVVALLIVHPVSAEPRVSRKAEQFQEEVLQGARVQTFAQRRAAYGDHQVLFVGLREPYFRPARFFRDQMLALRMTGYPDSRVKLVRSSWVRPFAENADRLAATLRKQHRGIPIVGVGNPTTSIDLLRALLRHPELIDDAVFHRLVLVQPANGTPLFENVPPGLRNLSLVAKNLPEKARAEMQAELDALSPERLQRLDDLIYVVRGGTTPGKMHPLFLAGALKLGRRGLNDGVSLVKDQTLPVGRDLGVLPVHHWTLFAARPAVASSPTIRRNFIQAVMNLALPGEE